MHSCDDILSQLQNWLNLFGVSIGNPSSSWIFKITHIEEPVTPSIFHPHSASWTAPPLRHTPRLRQCLLLGLVEIKVKAIPPSSKKQQPSSTPVSAELRLDLGFKQYFSIPLQTSTEGNCLFLKMGKHFRTEFLFFLVLELRLFFFSLALRSKFDSSCVDGVWFPVVILFCCYRVD
jgi:hypothetical protein